MNVNDAVHILVIDRGNGADAAAAEILRGAGFSATLVERPGLVQALIQETPPQCIVVPYGLPGTSPSGTLAQELKRDTIYGHLPILITVSPDDLIAADWTTLGVDEFVIEPFEPAELTARVRICLARALRDLNANPLTGLPGNIAIIREVEARLGRGDAFAVAYLDLDHFKPFNDKYGFLRGDEVLRMSARVVVNAARATRSENAFVGHVGGDDFVLIASSDVIEGACDEITRNFDLLIPNFYDEEDRIRGTIHSIDRQGNTMVFSMMTCSIAVIDTSVHAVKHVADISARAAQVKKYAKSIKGSTVCFDRRT